MTRLNGVGGTLFPGRFLADRFGSTPGHDTERRQFDAWWQRVTRVCGPASGLRALFDVLAMPLFGRLGFRASGATFDSARAYALLRTPRGSPVALALLPWAERRPGLWRDLTHTAHDVGASWCFVLAPPFMSIVDTRGHATRHAIEFQFPAALGPGSFDVFRSIASATLFDPDPVNPACGSRLDALILAAATFRDAVREDLQCGVEQALDAFAAVLGPTRRQDEALTLVYRILFLLFAESRDLVPHTHPIYGPAYAVSSLSRAAAIDPRGLWESMAAVTRLARMGCRADQLIVRPFNGPLFARESAPTLERHDRSQARGKRTGRHDAAMARALVALGSRRGAAGREDISYADLGVEQLGAVYERVLDLDGSVRGRARPSPASARGNHSQKRKRTGTFYTPQPLAEFVVRRTLSPLVSGRTTDGILALRVLDPAMGSGAFLVATCRYLASAYERALVDEGRAAATDIDDDARAGIRRLIAERCLSGVDRNPTAVQLARLSLWLTTLARGKPLSFLDHRLRTGNSLIGATPDDLWRMPTRRSSEGASLPLFERDALEEALRSVVRPLAALSERPDDTVDDVRAKEAAWMRIAGERSSIRAWRLAADAWCARWFPHDAHRAAMSPAETRAVIDAVLRRDRTLPTAHLARLLDDVTAASRAHGFFHWPLEFADVFYDDLGQARSQPGFDAVVGNPPWEMLRNDGDRKGARAPASRQSPPGDPLVRFIRQAGVYRRCDRGHINLYQPFIERAISLTRNGGRVGLIVPWGFATDDGAAALRRVVLDECGQQTFLGLDNARGLFPIHRGLRFLVIAATPGRPATEMRARFGITTAAELDGLPECEDGTEQTQYPVRFTLKTIAQVGGTAMRIPDARRGEDLALLERLTRQHPALGSEEGWRARFGRELNATEDSVHFGHAGLPVVDGKHLVRFAVESGATLRRLPEGVAATLLPDRRYERARLGYRDVSGVANKWSLIAAIVPRNVVTTHTIFCLRSMHSRNAMDFLCGVFNSYVLNAIVRMLMGGHLTTALVEALPVPKLIGRRCGLRIIGLSGRLRMGRASHETEPTLQAEVARLYDIDTREFRRLLEGFPLVPADERERAACALERRAE